MTRSFVLSACPFLSIALLGLGCSAEPPPAAGLSTTLAAPLAAENVETATEESQEGTVDLPDTMCWWDWEAEVFTCHECDPLAQDCPDGMGCYRAGGTFNCAPDASGDQGGLGEPCEFINVCDPGLYCVGAEVVESPACQGAAWCCTSFCDLTAPDCPEGHECEAVSNSPESGQENVGACIVPR